MTSSNRFRLFGRGRRLYLDHCLALVTPGRVPKPFVADRIVPGNLEGWDEEDRRLLIDEGRRHLDSLLGDLERTRTRAQQAFTTALALLVVVGAQLPTARRHGEFNVILWCVSGSITLIGLVGALSVMVVQVRASIIHAGVLSTYAPPIGPHLARDYAIVVGETTQTTLSLLTVYREAALYITLGAALNGAFWLITQL